MMILPHHHDIGCIDSIPYGNKARKVRSVFLVLGFVRLRMCMSCLALCNCACASRVAAVMCCSTCSCCMSQDNSPRDDGNDSEGSVVEEEDGEQDPTSQKQRGTSTRDVRMGVCGGCGCGCGCGYVVQPWCVSVPDSVVLISSVCFR